MSSPAKLTKFLRLWLPEVILIWNMIFDKIPRWRSCGGCARSTCFLDTDILLSLIRWIEIFMRSTTIPGNWRMRVLARTPRHAERFTTKTPTRCDCERRLAVMTPTGRRWSYADTWSSGERGGYVGGTRVNDRFDCDRPESNASIGRRWHVNTGEMVPSSLTADRSNCFDTYTVHSRDCSLLCYEYGFISFEMSVPYVRTSLKEYTVGQFSRL